MSGFDDLFKPFDDIIEDTKPIDDDTPADETEKEVWGKADSWNTGKKQDIWNNDNDKWDTKKEDKDDNPDNNIDIENGYIDDYEEEDEGYDLDIDDL